MDGLTNSSQPKGSLDHHILNQMAASEAGPGLIQELMDHSKTTWRAVLTGKATGSEYVEAAAEVAGAAMLARFGIKGLERLSKPVLETAEGQVPAARTVSEFESLTGASSLSNADARAAVLDRLVPAYSSRSVRLALETRLPRL